MSKKLIPTWVLGGSGYVAGELVRLLSVHPSFRIDGIASAGSVGERVGDAFPHLAGVLGDTRFRSLNEALDQAREARVLAVFSALPHGESAPALARFLDEAKGEVKAVDLSADLRFSDAGAFERVYGQPHPAPGLLSRFVCALPDLERSMPGPALAHPGCFTTAAVLAAAPLLAEGLVEPDIVVSAVTGSTGSGRTPKAGTHHPERHSGLWAYEPLRHRHTPEMASLLAPFSGAGEPRVSFVPHSGPFARGIHATVLAELVRPVEAEEVLALFERFYGWTPFVCAGLRMPSVKEVVGTNRCQLGIAVGGGRVAVTSVIDNLVKGAAGGGIQWMNRMFELEPTEGLDLPGLGWT